MAFVSIHETILAVADIKLAIPLSDRSNSIVELYNPVPDVYWISLAIWAI